MDRRARLRAQIQSLFLHPQVLVPSGPAGAARKRALVRCRGPRPCIVCPICQSMTRALWTSATPLHMCKSWVRRRPKLVLWAPAPGPRALSTLHKGEALGVAEGGRSPQKVGRTCVPLAARSTLVCKHKAAKHAAHRRSLGPGAAKGPTIGAEGGARLRAAPALWAEGPQCI